MQSLAAIRLDDDLGPHERLVLVMLASHANERGLAWPSVPTLMRETALSRSAVYRALAALETDGWIVRRHTPTHAGNVYDLAGLSRRAGGVSLGDGGVSLVDGGVSDRDEPVSHRDERGVCQTPEVVQRTIQELARAPAGARRRLAADEPPEAVAAFLASLAPVAPTPAVEGRHGAPRARAKALRVGPAGRPGRTPGRG